MPVIIENQFGSSNYDHIGKLITYSAAKEAGIVIWIANEFQVAHKEAIEWLNKISPIQEQNDFINDSESIMAAQVVKFRTIFLKELIKLKYFLSKK